MLAAICDVSVTNLCNAACDFCGFARDKNLAGPRRYIDVAVVLQGSAIVENGRIRATWFVVPQSGTGDLCGLRGEGGFQGEFGKESDGTLDYWFEP